MSYFKTHYTDPGHDHERKHGREEDQDQNQDQNKQRPPTNKQDLNQNGHQ